ncbi:hypothetical protein B1748_13515 [Paenibacillus sp. MY03]|jgi:hypothetical protein|nr:hypothetical protein B1748_13515 [Paenibacillus sp. MY03]
MWFKCPDYKIILQESTLYIGASFLVQAMAMDMEPLAGRGIVQSTIEQSQNYIEEAFKTTIKVELKAPFC